MCRPSQFAESVSNKHCSWHLLAEEIASVRQDRGHTGAHLLAVYDRCLPDQDASYIGDGIERSRRDHPDLHARLAHTWMCGIFVGSTNSYQQ